MKRYQSGLTMVEALVVLGVVSVMLTVATPSLTAYVEANQADADAKDFYASLLQARSESVLRNSMVSLCKIDPATPNSCNNSEDWQSGWIAFQDDDADGVRDADESIIDTFTGMTINTTVTTVNYDNVVSYLPSGGITTNGSITFCVSGNVANSIIINATGRPRLVEASCS